MPITANSSSTTSQEDTALLNWQTYTNDNFSFKIRYPKEWVYKEYSNDYSGKDIFFGPVSSASEGYIWGITIFEVSKLEEVIAQIGQQFSDRKENRKPIIFGKDLHGTEVTGTTNELPNWTSTMIFIERDGHVFVIADGAMQDPDFKLFANSFEFIDSN
ncbi:MAG: hypothetical protein KBC69_03760 [Candidatus Magasanikbacteria bacterium]|nr:hypothetical protein [Candidatus Magasanikbacteria bacterium]